MTKEVVHEQCEAHCTVDRIETDMKLVLRGTESGHRNDLPLGVGLTERLVSLGKPRAPTNQGYCSLRALCQQSVMHSSRTTRRLTFTKCEN